jgi:hypothetical protein
VFMSVERVQPLEAQQADIVPTVVDDACHGDRI